MKLPTNKKEELILAANIIWFSGVFLTTIYVLSANNNLSKFWYPVVFLFCMGIQYAMTKIESALFNGNIPSPWSQQRATKTTWVWGGAVVVLFMDVFVNLGGVGYVSRFIRNSASGDILKTEFGASDTALRYFTNLIIVVLAGFVAVGSELLRMYAEEIDKINTFEEVPQITIEEEKEDNNGIEELLEKSRNYSINRRINK